MSSTQQKSKKDKSKKQKSQQDQTQPEDLFNIDEAESVVQKVNQDKNNKKKYKSNNSKQNSDNQNNLTSSVLKELPQKEPNTRKRKSSTTESDCSTPSSQRSTISERFKEFIGHFRRAPDFLVDNKYIHSGYRVNYNSVKSVFKSLFHIHNESVNIWTHALGAIFVIVLIIYIIVRQNIIDLDINGFKNHLVEDFKERFDPLYAELQQFDSGLNEYVQKIQEGYEGIKWSEFNDKIHSKFTNILDELKDIKDHPQENIDLLADKIVHLPATMKSYIKELEDLNLDENETYKNFKQFVKGFQSDYMQAIIQKSLDSGNDNFVLQELSLWPIYIFLVTAFLCLLFSATFHLFFVYKEKYYKYFLRLDYAGVSLLISGSTMPSLYYGFYCQLDLAIFYITLTSLASLIVFIVSLQDFIHTPKYWAIKSIMYGSLGIFAAFPLIHLAIHESFYSQGDTYSTIPSLIYYGLMGVCYLGGLFVYAYRCPERYKPGQFDICGASHQIWHVSIVLAIIVTYIAVMINFYTRSNSLCPKNDL